MVDRSTDGNDEWSFPRVQAAASRAPNPSAGASLTSSAAEDTTGAGSEAAASGRFAFASAGERDAECAALRENRAIVVELEGIGPSLRGRLADVIDEAIERELQARRAGSPGLACSGATGARDRHATLSDQLFRARRAGATTLAVVLGPLRAAATNAGGAGAMDPEDSATLRFWANAAKELPVVLLLDERDATTRAYEEPVELAQMLSAPGLAAALAFARAPSPPRPSAPAPAPAPAPARALPRDEPWRDWTQQLIAARGPQPLPALERIFTDTYVPLANAIAGGLDDPRARAAHEEFRASFARSYTEAFPTFASTTKRPRMVLDVHDTAGRIARLHGARSTRMLLVDAMRWDVARLVQQRVAARLEARASVTDELVLWSALPTTTMRQLETIARGIEAIRAPGEMDDDAEPPRGRTAEYVRRLRVGPREVHKLDVVESRLQGARGGVLRALPDIADATADAIARHAETLAPNTLLFVFGDHGFTIDRTGAARQGGPSPEEVLVGAFALLVGDTH